MAFKELPPHRGQIVNRTHSNGRGVCEMWSFLFLQNEELPPDKKLTDAEISAEMFKAFPDRLESEVFKQVQKVRGRYNRGVLTGGAIPKVKSCRYERLEDGTVIKREFRKKRKK